MTKKVLFIITLLLLVSCHTQRSAVEEKKTEVDSLQIHKTEVQSFFVDSLIKEMFISADTVCMISLPDQSTHLVAQGLKVTARKSMIKESKSKVAIEDTTSLHIRDTTFVENKVDKQAVYEPPDIRTFLLFFALLFLIYLVFERR